MKLMNDKRDHFESIIESRLQKVLKKLDSMEGSKKKSWEDIDKVFDEVIEKAKARCS